MQTVRHLVVIFMCGFSKKKNKKIQICGLVKVKMFEIFSMLVEVWEDVRSMQALLLNVKICFVVVVVGIKYLILLQQLFCCSS